ncbi:hypothetical protein B7463_g3216, partial [Scytalidium lignicola]
MPGQKDGYRAIGGDQEREAADQADDGDTVDGHAGFGALEEDLGRLVITGKRVQRPRGRVEVLDANDPWRSSSPRATAVQCIQEASVARGADDAHSKDADHIEAHETVEDEFGNAWNSASRVLDLAGCHGDQVRASNVERSIADDAPPAQETASRARGVIRMHRHTMFPVPEAVGVVLGIAADHGDEGKEHEADEKQDLGRRHDELGLTIPLDGDDVNVSVPVLNDSRHGRVFDTHQHRAAEEIRPTHSEAHSGIHVTAGELEDLALDGQPCDDFGGADIARPDEGDAPEDVAQHEGQRTGLGQVAPDADEERGANGSADGHELDVSRFQSSPGRAQLLPVGCGELAFEDIAVGDARHSSDGLAIRRGLHVFRGHSRPLVLQSWSEMGVFDEMVDMGTRCMRLLITVS